MGEAVADLMQSSMQRKYCRTPQPCIRPSTDCHASPQSPSCYYETTALADAFGPASPMAAQQARSGVPQGQQQLLGLPWAERSLPSASHLGTYATVRGHAARHGSTVQARGEDLALWPLQPPPDQPAFAAVQPQTQQQGFAGWPAHSWAGRPHAAAHTATRSSRVPRSWLAQVTTGYAAGGQAAPARVVHKRPADSAAAHPPLAPCKLARTSMHPLSRVHASTRTTAQHTQPSAAGQQESPVLEVPLERWSGRQLLQQQAEASTAPLHSSDAHSICCAHAGTALRLPPCALDASWPLVDFAKPAASDASEEVDSAQARHHRQHRHVPSSSGALAHDLFAAPQSHCAATVQEMLVRERRELVSLLWHLSDAGPSVPRAITCSTATHAEPSGQVHALEGFGESSGL